MSAKEKRKRRRKAERLGLWAILFTFELLAASVPATLAAKVLLPLGRAVRGYETFGVEWMVISAVFCIAYALAHKYACDKIFEEGLEVKPGDKVTMNDNYHVSEANKGKVWTVMSEPWDCCGTMVVKLEGKSGGYAVDGLDLVKEG